MIKVWYDVSSQRHGPDGGVSNRFWHALCGGRSAGEEEEEEGHTEIWSILTKIICSGSKCASCLSNTRTFLVF